MKEFFVVLRRLEVRERWTDDPELGSDAAAFYAVGEYPTLARARAAATRSATQTNSPRYVARILGAQVAVYDPDVGWEPAEVPA